MKRILLLVLAVAPFTAQAEDLTCPKGEQQILSCTEATQTTDDQLAVDFMTAGIVCGTPEEATMYLLSEGEVSPLIDIQAGIDQDSYTTTIDDGTMFEIRKIGEATADAPNGTFTISGSSGTHTRSLTCK